MLKRLGNNVPMDIIILSEKGQLDTVNFNNREDIEKLKAEKEEKVIEALELVKLGIKKYDPVLIGRGATISSLAHQSILYKPYLDRLVRFVNGDQNIYGINIAHSGTLVGILINPEMDSKSLVKYIWTNFPKLQYVQRVKTIDGGLQAVQLLDNKIGTL